MLVARPLKLLTFQAPEYEMDATRGLVRWRIARGLLVSRQGRNGRGYLQIEVRRYPGDDPDHARLHVEVEVANFYPSIASRLSRRIYNATQSRIHVIVTYGVPALARALGPRASRGLVGSTRKAVVQRADRGLAGHVLGVTSLPSVRVS